MKLRRGPWSRLFGDAVLGWTGGSQFLIIVVTALLAPIRGWEWVPFAGIVGLAVLAMTWTYELRGTRLVGKVFGCVLLDADLSGASVDIESAPVGHIATSDIVVIFGATIHRKASIFGRNDPVLRLGYGTWIGRKRRKLWLQEICARTTR